MKIPLEEQLRGDTGRGRQEEIALVPSTENQGLKCNNGDSGNQRREGIHETYES